MSHSYFIDRLLHKTFRTRIAAYTINAALSVLFANGLSFKQDGSGNYGFFDAAGNEKFILSSGGTITKYGNINTSGNGVEVIVGANRFTGQIAAVANVASFAVPFDMSFIVSANILVTTSTTHTFTLTVSYTDEGNTARVLTMSFILVAGGALVTSIANANGAVPYHGVPLHIRAKGGTTVQLATTGTFTTVTYNVEGQIRQIA